MGNMPSPNPGDHSGQQVFNITGVYKTRHRAAATKSGISCQPLEIIKKMLAVPVIIIGVLFGIKIMIVGMIINSLISYFLNSYWSGKFINYHISEQLRDIMPSFILASFIAVSVFALGCLLHLSYPVRLIVQVSTGALLFFGICELTKMGDYIYMKQIVLEKIFKRN